MRFLHCADLHIGAAEAMPKPLGGLSGPLPDAFQGLFHLQALVKAALFHNVDAFLIAGDLFDRSARDFRCAREAAELLKPLRKAGMPILATDGNHDCSGDKPQPTLLEQLHATGVIRLLRPQLDTCGEPYVSEYEGGKGCLFHIKGVRILGLGYLGLQTRRRMRTLLYALPPCHFPTVCMLHSGVYADGTPLPLGGVRPADMIELASHAAYMALGHRHAREEGVCWYNPGSPNGVRLKNKASERGYYLIEFISGQVSRKFVSTR